MKLWNMLVVGTIGTLAAVGCSSTTTTTTDGGTVTGDTGTTPPVDTGTTPPVDTGTTPPVDTGTPGGTCADCQKSKCATETDACSKDPKCGERITCMNACIGKPMPAECQNACISSIASTAADDLIECLQTNCKAECFSAG